jgi:hypothetical protein
MLRPPVALGCAAAVVVVTLVVLAFVFFVVFLGGGTASDSVTLSDADAYAPGTVTYNGDHNFYIVRLKDTGFIILADMDAANRASTTRKCRVQPMKTDDPNLLKFLQQYATKMSPEAQATTFLFREECNGAVYDITGVRLDAEGPNLARYSSSIDSGGKLVVDLQSQHCTQRQGTNLFAATSCVP